MFSRTIPIAAAAASFLLAGLANATINDMRATLPGSLHQCESTSVFFFDTDDSGSKTLLLLSSSDSTKLGSGTVSLKDALSSTTPYQQINDITSADTAQFPFELKVAENTAFEAWGFLSTGQGKNLNLPRTVMSPLPGAANCVSSAVAQAASPVAISTTSSSSVSSPVAATTPSGFVSVIKPAAVTSSSMSTSLPVPAPATTTGVVPTTPPAVNASSTIASTAVVSADFTTLSTTTPLPVTSASNPPAASVSPVVVKTTYLFTSFISVSNSTSSDGSVSSVSILGGHTTGSLSGTISAFGSALFQHSDPVTSTTAVTTANSSTVTVGADKANNVTTALLTGSDNTTLHIISANFMFTTDDGSNETIFVNAQTPLNNNITIDSMAMSIRSSGGNNTLANLTVLGKPQAINSTMFRLDAYYQ